MYVVQMRSVCQRVKTFKGPAILPARRRPVEPALKVILKYATMEPYGAKVKVLGV